MIRVIAASLITSGLVTVAGVPSDDRPPRPSEIARQNKPKFSIGKETTYVTGPVDKDGYIDYAAALNERLGKDVTPENNANVLLWKVIGPRPDWSAVGLPQGKPVPAEYFKAMGMEPPPENGSYFIRLKRYITEQLKIDDSERANEVESLPAEARKRPWKPDGFPQIAAWLKLNAAALDRVVEASKRPRYFSPWLGNSSETGHLRLIAYTLPGVQCAREFCDALAARAMLLLGQGQTSEAWEDILACHRLGRLMAGGGLIEYLVGAALDGTATSVTLRYLAHANLDAKQLRVCLGELQNLSPTPSIATRFGLCERLWLLDATFKLAQSAPENLESIQSIFDANDEQSAKMMKDIRNWDPMLRSINQSFDRLVAALRIKNIDERQKAIDQLEAEAAKLKEMTLDASQLEAKDRDAQIGKYVADRLMSAQFTVVGKMHDVAYRVEQSQRNLHVAFALACYHRENDRYPEKLGELAPAYLAHIPADVFNDRPLIYDRWETGYVFYSVGINRKDDGGQSYADVPRGDDIGVRTALPPPGTPVRVGDLQPLDGVGTGTLKGTFTYDGDPPMRRDFADRMKEHADREHCLAKDAKNDTKDPTWIVNSDKEVQNVVVWIRAPAGKYIPIRPEQRKRTDVITIDQPFCMFQPHVVTCFPSYFDGKQKKQVATGQKFKALNSGPFQQNVRWSGNPLVNSGMNLVLPPKGETEIHANPCLSSTSGEDLLRLHNDRHTWMSAYAWVFDHPFHAVTGEHGWFEIKGVPANVELEIVYWHESMGQTPKVVKKTLTNAENDFSQKLK